MSSSKRDYYEVLGLKKDATPEEISKAYKKKAMLYHPDRQYGKSEAEKKEAEEKFKEVAEAYDVLNSADKRAKYDQFGFSDDMHQEGFDPFDMFRRFAGFGFGESDFGFGSRRRSQSQQPMQTPDFDSPEDGRDIEIRMQVPFKTMLFGGTSVFDFDGEEECHSCHGRGVKDGTKPKVCSKCGGSGRIVQTSRNGFMMSQTISPCPDCHGEGIEMERCPVCSGQKRIPKKKHVSLKIPQGIQDGQRLRLAGSGECGVRGGKNGDMYVRIFVEELDDVKRNGYDLKLKMPLNPIIATLGGEIEVPTPWTVEKLAIPRGTTSGKVLTLHGKGIRDSKRSGDLQVLVVVEPLEKLTAEQTKLLESLKNTTKSVFQDEKLAKYKSIFKKN